MAKKERKSRNVEVRPGTSSWRATESAWRESQASDAKQAQSSAEQVQRENAFSLRAEAANDTAELELYGSRGREYTDPETGAVIADADNPVTGKLEYMRNDRQLGRTEAERQGAADMYEAAILRDVEGGLPLAQAKLIADLELTDIEKRGKLIGEHISRGKGVDEARDLVDALLCRLADNRRRCIIEGGALSMSDYEELRGGKDLYAAETTDTSDDEPVDEPDKPTDTPDDEPVDEPGKELELRKEPELIDVEGMVFPSLNKYAELTARDRKSYFVGRYTKDERSLTGKILRKIGLGKAFNGLNERQGKEIDQAREEYELAMADAQGALHMEMSRLGYSQIEAQQSTAELARDIELLFESMVINHRSAQSKDTNKFVNWWVKQEGKKGMFKKAGVVLGAGAAIGLTAGTVLPGLLATAAGGATGAAIGNHVTRRRANAVDENGHSIAEKQAADDANTKEELIDDLVQRTANGGEAALVKPNDLTTTTEDRSDKLAFENRSRLRKATSLGAAGATLANLTVAGAGRAWEFFQGDGGGANYSYPNHGPAGEAPNNVFSGNEGGHSGSGLKTTEMRIDAGQGEIRGVQNFLADNGIKVDTTQAERIGESVKNILKGGTYDDPLSKLDRVATPGSYELGTKKAKALLQAAEYYLR